MYIRDSRKGSAMVLTMSLLVIIIGISGTFLMTSHHRSSSTDKYHFRILAQYAAKGGLNIAAFAMNKKIFIQRIEGHISHLDSIIYTTDNVSWKRLQDDTIVTGGNSGDWADTVYDAKDLPLRQRENSHFRVVIEQNGEADGAIFTAYRAVSSAVYKKMSYTMMGYVNRDRSSHKLPGILGYRGVTIDESGVIDSYNSKVGAYGVDGNMNADAQVGSNGDIVIGGDCTTMLYGDAIPGVGGTTIGSEYMVAGKDTSPRPSPITEPSELNTDWLRESTLGKFADKSTTVTNFTTDAHYDSISFKGVVRIHGDVSLYCHGSFTANSTGNLILEPGARLVLYVNGNFSYNGGFQCLSLNPNDFTIKIMRDDREVEPLDFPDPLDAYSIKVNGTSTMYAIFDAPWSNVKISGGSDFYGSLTSQRLWIGGNGNGPDPHYAKIHYDESLGATYSEHYTYFLHTILSHPFEE